MNMMKKIFPLSSAMTGSLKKYLIGMLIYAGIYCVADFLLSLPFAILRLPVALLSLIPYVGALINMLASSLLSSLEVIPTALVGVYCFTGAIFLTVLFWKSHIQREQVKKIFPAAFLFIENGEKFAWGCILFVVIYFVADAILLSVGVAFLLLDAVFGVLCVVWWMYYVATVTMHILAFRESGKKES